MNSADYSIGHIRLFGFRGSFVNKAIVFFNGGHKFLNLYPLFLSTMEPPRLYRRGTFAYPPPLCGGEVRLAEDVF
jgi:hypothetical protein